MSDRELLTECLDVLTHDAAQRTFAGGVRMSQLAIKLRAALAAPSPEIQVMVDPAALTAAAAYAPVRIVTPDDAEIAQAAKFEKAYQNNRTALAAPSLAVTVDPRLTPDEAAAISSALAAPEPVAKSCWACNGKGFLRDIDTAGLLPCVVCKPQEDKT